METPAKNLKTNIWDIPAIMEGPDLVIVDPENEYSSLPLEQKQIGVNPLHVPVQSEKQE